MEKRLKDYEKLLEELLQSNDMAGMERLYPDILVQIGFFQHERLIHLIVTVTFAILAMLALMFFTQTGLASVLVLFLLFMVLLVPYIRHYYILENKTQHLYALYDRIRERVTKVSDTAEVPVAAEDQV